MVIIYGPSLRVKHWLAPVLSITSPDGSRVQAQRRGAEIKGSDCGPGL